MYQKLKKTPQKGHSKRGKPTRKQLRKEKRLEKKHKRVEYHNKKRGHISVKEIETVAEEVSRKHEKSPKVKEKTVKNEPFSGNKVLTIEELHKKEKREQKKVQKGMSKHRKEQLLKENEKEDRLIKKLEKQLKLHKRKSKTIPKSFCDDGLDYLLEVCDPEYMKNAALAEQDLNEGNDNFDEDLALMSGQKVSEAPSNGEDSDNFDDDESEEEEDLVDSDAYDEESEEQEPVDSEENESEVDVSDEELRPNKRKQHPSEDDDNVKKRKTLLESEPEKDNNLWEDIYGRLRTQDGEVVNTNAGKYVPPAIRAQMEGQGSEDKKRKEKLERLRKQLKGLLNRLAESNLHGISSQIEQLYMNNSRNDMNDTLTTLVLDSLVTNVLSPERLLMEHILLVAVLHANVGTEIGAHFLQTVVKKFDLLRQNKQPVEDKSLDNVVNILAQLYNFKVFDAKLLYEILGRLTGTFDEKNVDCVLHVLRSVGFGLRKDDPLALKSLILDLQKRAAALAEGKVSSDSRVKFLLDVLLAIKNNNVTKIPNYDTSYSEHLKKIMKGFIRKGNYVTTLNICLEDLLKADERGKWWVVGSAWTGTNDSKTPTDVLKSPSADNYSRKLLDLAKKQRMNTDTRRDVFCVIMSAEDYMDAFEKLLKLGLKNQQEREIIHVILHCCLQEKVYNPYYAVLAQKFCEYDRKFQMTIKCSVWDKLKALNSHSGHQLANLAKLLTHLFIEQGLPISTLKIVEFSELDKMTLRLMRQILLGILLHDNSEAVHGVFEKVAHSDKLKMFRESLRLFIHHFLLRNLKGDAIETEKKRLLEERVRCVEKILTRVKENRMKF